MNIGHSGYKDQIYWNDIKHLIIREQKKLDLAATVDIRNMFVRNHEEEKAFISFLEQKSIAILFMFGKANKFILNYNLHF